jgi:UDP-glucose 4-epimerase
MTERIVVTGAGGFLGSHICHYFGTQGSDIVAVGRFSSNHIETGSYQHLREYYGMTLPDPTFVKTFKDFKPTTLVHCAGSASVGESLIEPYEDFQQSVSLCASTLEILRQHAPSCRFVFLSSAAVYGNPMTLPISETMPCRPISPYGFHKSMCELICNEYHLLYGIPVSTIRIFSAYGERLRKQVIFDVCRKLSHINGDSIDAYGTGNETRDFIHAFDVAQAIECIMTAKADGIFNVASGYQTKISDIVRLVNESLGSKKTVRYSGISRAGDPLTWQGDISKISGIGFQQRVPLEKGIQSYCQWFMTKWAK